MKKVSIIFLFIFIIATMLFTLGCSKQAVSGYMENSPSDIKNGTSFYNRSGDALPAENEPSAETPTDNYRKIIKTAKIEMETLEFEESLKGINGRMNEMGGYAESNNIGSRYKNMRYATIVARIPADKYDAFINAINGYGTILNQSENVADVTETYVDIEAKLQSLRTEYDTLLGLLEKAETLNDVITIQDRLSQVRYNIESSEARKRVYDNQITYSTITISLNEVERPTPVEKEDFGAEVSRRFKESLEDVGEGFRSFAAWFLGDFPHIFTVLLFFIALPILIAVLIIKGIKKSCRKRKEKILASATLSQVINTEKPRQETPEQ